MTEYAITNARDLLIKAKSLIADEQHWHKGSWAKNVSADTTTLPDNYCFCSWGTIEYLHSYREEVSLDVANEALSTLDAVAFDRDDFFATIIGYNDDPDTTHADIMSVFDEAIRRQDA